MLNVDSAINFMLVIVNRLIKLSVFRSQTSRVRRLRELACETAVVMRDEGDGLLGCCLVHLMNRRLGPLDLRLCHRC